MKISKNSIMNVVKVIAGGLLVFVGVKGFIPEKKEEALPEAPITPDAVEEPAAEPVNPEVTE